jgi:O-acetyl-ADP-ribose deacetylase (regulator of RNase III)
MPFKIVHGDITKLRVDAIVNAANTSLRMGGGVCGAIFSAAGADRLKAACDKLAPIQTGDAVITPGFGLPAKYVIHTAGPVYRNGQQGEEALLRSCYINSLELATKHNCESIAFPLISSGIYGYPKAEALHVATDAISGFICEHDINVSLVVFDKEAFAVSEDLLGAVNNYIDEHSQNEWRK